MNSTGTCKNYYNFSRSSGNIPQLLQYYTRVVEYIPQLFENVVGVVEFIPQLLQHSTLGLPNN